MLFPLPEDDDDDEEDEVEEEDDWRRGWPEKTEFDEDRYDCKSKR